MNEELRIGVFVCDCGTNIAGFLDVPEVCEYAKTLPDVVYVKENMYTCSNAGIQEIMDAIPEHRLNRVVVASCTPRTHEPLFRKACEDAGLNKFLFEFVNIRDQCSWVHQKEREKATEKAKDLVRMGVARARLLEPLEEIEIPVEKSSLVIGGGVAGMTAALSLAEQGFTVHLVERESTLGGLLKDINEVYPSHRDAGALLEEMQQRIERTDAVHVYLESEVANVEGYIGNFRVTLTGACEDELTVGTIIVATGAQPYEPVYMYNYDEYENVITQYELERMLKEKKMGDWQRIVFIQCVGGRGERVRYCSRICCMNSIKNARLLKKLLPDAEIYIIHRGMQTYGTVYEEYVREAREEGVRFIRVKDAIPTASALEKRNGTLMVGFYHPGLRRKMDIEADLVVLATPLIQREDAKHISQLLKVPLGQEGFFFEAHVKLRPVDFATDGIFMAGSCRAPADINECMMQALAAASRAAIPMAKGYVTSEGIKASVNKELCVGCDACVISCPYKAIEISPFGQPSVIEASCKGCGVCVVECPMGAMQLLNYKDEQITAAVDALMEQEEVADDEEFEPVIACFACQWCSYAAADFAGVARIQYAPNIRIIRVPCSGRVDALHILAAFNKGVDGVMVTGCHIGDCHYIDGNVKAKRRIETLKKSLPALNIDPERLKLGWASASEGMQFATMVNEFVAKIKEMGPSPLRKKRGG